MGSFGITYCCEELSVLLALLIALMLAVFLVCNRFRLSGFGLCSLGLFKVVLIDCCRDWLRFDSFDAT